MATGKVFLIGAGPGDIELLTLKAVRALQQADVILLDDLVNPDVLLFAKPNASVLHVGKRGGSKSTPQTFIDKMKKLPVTKNNLCEAKLRYFLWVDL